MLHIKMTALKADYESKQFSDSLQHAIDSRNFNYWFYRGRAHFIQPSAPVVFKLQNPFQVSQGFIVPGFYIGAVTLANA